MESEEELLVLVSVGQAFVPVPCMSLDRLERDRLESLSYQVYLWLAVVVTVAAPAVAVFRFWKKLVA